MKALFLDTFTEHKSKIGPPTGQKSKSFRNHCDHFNFRKRIMKGLISFWTTGECTLGIFGLKMFSFLPKAKSTKIAKIGDKMYLESKINYTDEKRN